jgi:tetratricopeptide (TPR) repeat protein
VDKKNFIQVLRNPKEISENELDDLELVVSQYPYFQTARAILASGSKALGKYDSDKKLSTAAIYTTNRNLLKRYVFESLDFSQISDIRVGGTSSTTSDTQHSSDTSKKKKNFIFVERKEEITERTGKGKFIDLTKKTDEDDEDYLVVSESVTTGDSADWETKVANQESIEVQKPIEKEEANTSRKIVARKPEVFTQLPPRINNDELVDEVFKNLEEYQKRKSHYTEVELRISELEETEAVNEAILKASEKLKANTDAPEKTTPTPAPVIIEPSPLQSKINNPVDEVERQQPTPIVPVDHSKSQEPEEELKDKNVAKIESQDDEVPRKVTEQIAAEDIEEKSDTTTTNNSLEEEPEIPKRKVSIEAKEIEKKSADKISDDSEIKKPIIEKIEKVENKSKVQESEKDMETSSSKSEEEVEDTFAKMVADIKKTNTNEEPPAKNIPNEVAKTKPVTPKSGKVQKQAVIIESFINANPKIVPSEEDSNKEIKDLSVDSTNLKDGLATENLAKIFLKQGKREKAIEIYEQLILINPDKKSYFASQISKLK